MKFIEIDAGTTVFPGEYILHVPTSEIVLVGAFNREEKKEFRRKTCKKCKGKLT
jgi:hypothetical protein